MTTIHIKYERNSYGNFWATIEKLSDQGCYTFEARLKEILSIEQEDAVRAALSVDLSEQYRRKDIEAEDYDHMPFALAFAIDGYVCEWGDASLQHAIYSDYVDVLNEALDKTSLLINKISY